MSTCARLEDSVRSGSTVGSIQTTDLLDALRALGADTSALSASAGLRSRELADPEARVDSTRAPKLFDPAAVALHDPSIGVHAGAMAHCRRPPPHLLTS